METENDSALSCVPSAKSVLPSGPQFPPLLKKEVELDQPCPIDRSFEPQMGATFVMLHFPAATLTEVKRNFKTEGN